jgi:hypothetical protein
MIGKQQGMTIRQVARVLAWASSQSFGKTVRILQKNFKTHMSRA